MSYHHFTIEERCCLREYYKKGCSYRKIAELMGRNVSSSPFNKRGIFPARIKQNIRKYDIFTSFLR